MESATTSRETSEARIPDVPIAIPSVTTMVLNSSGVPPASRTPIFTCSDNARRCQLQGVISVQVFAIPMSGREIASSVRPIAFHMARAPARAGPLLTSSASHGVLLGAGAAGGRGGGGPLLCHDPVP